MRVPAVGEVDEAMGERSLLHSLPAPVFSAQSSFTERGHWDIAHSKFCRAIGNICALSSPACQWEKMGKLDEKFFLSSNKPLIKVGAMIKYFQRSQTFLVSAAHSKIFKGEIMSLVFYLKYFSKACMSQRQLLPCSCTGCY